MKEELNWESIHNRNVRPQAGNLYVVKGFVIVDGRTTTKLDLAKYNGNMFLDDREEKPLKDMVIEQYTIIKRI